MKFFEYLLYVILAAVISTFFFILLCFANPDLYAAVNKVVNNHATSTVEVPEDASAAFSSEAFEEPEPEVEEANEEPVSNPTYEEYVEKWSIDGIDDEYLNDATYDQFVKDFTEGIIDGFSGDYDEEEMQKAFEDSNESHSDYKVPEAEVVIVEDAEEAGEVVKDTFVGETGENEEFDPLYYPYYGILNDKGKRLYKQIYANAVALNESFLPVEDATTSEWNTAMFSVVYDHPELFWVDTSIYQSYDYNGNVIKLTFYYYDEFQDIPKAQDEFNAATQELLAGAKNLGSDYEKEKYIHDLLDNKLTYEENDLDQSSYSAIVEDYTVCAGYAKGFQHLMQQLEVPTYTCVGWGGFGLLFGSMHGWNIIKLDSDFYNVDCTWDDDEPISYEYFNLSDNDNSMHTRMFNSVYLPPCNGSKYAGLEKRTLADYKLSEGDVISNLDDYYAYCKHKTLNDNEKTGDSSYKCEFNVVISGDIYKEWKAEYDRSAEYDKYLDDVIETLGDSKKYDLFIPIGLVLCDTEELAEGSWLITHYVYMGYAGSNF